MRLLGVQLHKVPGSKGRTKTHIINLKRAIKLNQQIPMVKKVLHLIRVFLQRMLAWILLHHNMMLQPVNLLKMLLFRRKWLMALNPQELLQCFNLQFLRHDPPKHKQGDHLQNGLTRRNQWFQWKGMSSLRPNLKLFFLLFFIFYASYNQTLWKSFSQ